MIDFYYSPTPNGWKVAIMLEECGLDYRTILLQLHKGEQLAPEFLRINPTGQTPAIVDHDAGSEPVAVFDSTAILLYLANKTGRFAPAIGPMAAGTSHWELLQWLFWHAADQGPAAGQLSHFVNYAPADQEYGRRRSTKDYRRDLGVLENRLRSRNYILGDYSIADMACFPWVFIAKRLGVDLSHYPAVQAWRGDIKSRPAVQRAIDLHKDQQPVDKHKRERQMPPPHRHAPEGQTAPGGETTRYATGT
ncbi:MAG TPA: glutathione S-transferase N-terminal domain-containing protein [Arenicellales bacterium]|nr:glutathione S-transferase N-terminal domain-containing protein [Arenicellales bacterium]